jgi:hypothetical protein
MPRRLPALRLLCLGSTTLALLILAVSVGAQERPRTLPTDGEQAFLREYQKQRQRFKVISSASSEGGEKANKDSAEDQRAIDVMAQYYTYRLTWDTYHAAGGVNTLWEEFFSQVNNADSDAMRKNNPAFPEMYLKALAQRAREVMLTARPIAAVNAARMLARLAKAGSEEAGDACLDAVKDENKLLEPKARLGAQYWALQGLGSLLGRWAEAPPAEGQPAAARKERETNYLLALAQTAQRKLTDGPVPPAPDEVEGAQVFRREAVRALAQYRLPAVADEKGNVKVPTALVLLRVVNDDNLSPKARIDEQIEAAIGVARVQAKALPAYQPDYAAQQIGYLVVKMGREARPLTKDPNKFAWKVYAARLADAIEVMRSEAKGSPDKAGAAYVDKMAGLALRVLKDIETAQTIAGNHNSDLNLWLADNPPPHDTLYKGLADSKVRPLEKGEGPDKAEDTKPAERKPDEKPKKPEDKPKKPDDKPKKP